MDWKRKKAHELGLIDQLGGLEVAIKAAGDLAQLAAYDTLLIEHELSAKDRFYQNLFGEVTAFVPDTYFKATQGPIEKMLKETIQQFTLLEELNDPQGIYAFCVACEFPL